MFYGTAGGKSFDSDVEVCYVFPDTAYLKIQDVNIPLGGLLVRSFGGLLLVPTIDDFYKKIIKRIKPTRENIYTIPTIRSAVVMGELSLDKDTCSKYNQSHNFISLDEYKAHENGTIDISEKIKALSLLSKKIADEHKAELKTNLTSILTQNNRYPKFISFLYRDHEFPAHITHVILKFLNKDQYSVEIQHTASTALFENVKGLFDKNIDLETCIEKFDGANMNGPDNPGLLCIEDRFSSASQCISFPLSVKEILLQNFYPNLLETLQNILPNKNIKKVEITNHHNQKLAEECGSYSIQNQIDFLTPPYLETQSNIYETPRERGIRLRAEHLVLSCALTNECPIPLPSQEFLIENRALIEYEPLTYKQNWYRNSEIVLNELKTRINDLPLSARKILYSGIDNSTMTRTTLASTFKPSLHDSINSYKDKILSTFSFFTPSNEQNVFSKGFFSTLLCMSLPALLLAYCVRRCRKNKNNEKENEVNDSQTNKKIR